MFKREFVILGVVSLTMGNSPFPLADGLVGHVQRRGKLLLGHPLFSAQLGQKMAERGLVQFVHTFCLLSDVLRPFLASLYRSAPSRATDGW